MGRDNKYDIVITEIGGTVGDIESLPFVEAVRQLQWELPEEDCGGSSYPDPLSKSRKRIKNKTYPAQCKNAEPGRCASGYHRLPHGRTAVIRNPKERLRLFCNVKPEAVIEAADASTIYEVPLTMMREKLDVICLKKLNITGLSANPN